MPGSGNLLLACDDGGFDNAYSVDLKFEVGRVLCHGGVRNCTMHVNRNSDGIGSNSPYYGYLDQPRQGVSTRSRRGARCNDLCLN